jgi:hypothetical protein
MEAKRQLQGVPRSEKVSYHPTYDLATRSAEKGNAGELVRQALGLSAFAVINNLP